MITHTALFKTDSTRRIDGVIDYFGETWTSAFWRTTGLTRRRDLNLLSRRHPGSIRRRYIRVER